MNITTVGLDLAKSVFQVHGVDERGKDVLRKTLKRAEVASFFARLAPCLIGMEACGSANVTWNTCLLEFTVQGSIAHGSSTGFFDEQHSLWFGPGHPGRSP
jgi:hypothetical protein